MEMTIFRRASHLLLLSVGLSLNSELGIGGLIVLSELAPLLEIMLALDSSLVLVVLACDQGE